MLKKITTAGALVVLSVAILIAFAHTASAQVFGQQTVQTNSKVIVRDLTIGSTGMDVTSLQLFLINNGYLGFTPGYFDQQTKAAVVKFQAANGLPTTGYFGPMSRTVYHRLVGGTVTNPNVPTQGNCPSGFVPATYNGVATCILPVSGNVSNSGNNSGSLRGDEASLENFEVNEGDETELDEGDNGSEIMEVEFDVEDGDIEILRTDVLFTFTGDSSSEDRPWEIFDRVYLLSNDDEIGDIDASNRDEWMKEDSDEYVLRFSDLNEIIRENDTAEFTIEVDVQDDIDNFNEDLNEWEVSISEDGIRGVDADRNTQQIGDEDESITITIGDDNNDNDDDNNDFGLTVSESNDNPDSMDIDVYEDDESDWETIFAFELTAEDEEISLLELPITIDFLNGGSYKDVIEDIEITIDGDSFDDFNVSNDDDDQAVITFNIDNDITINEDETVTVEVRVIFREADGNFDDGDEIQAYIDDENVENIEAENEDGDSIDEEDLNGSAYGETHTLTVND